MAEKGDFSIEIDGILIENMTFRFDTPFAEVEALLNSNNVSFDTLEITNDSTDWDYGHKVLTTDNFILTFDSSS